jgi:hypothetical protein
MNTIPANQKLPITIDLAANNLFAGLTVFDTTTGAPVKIVGQPGQTNNVYPMINVAGSFSYLTFFTGLPQHTYLLLVQQFTDGTYTVLDGALNLSHTLAAKIMAPVFIQNLKVLTGCEDQPLQRPVVVAQNSDGNVLLTFFDDNGIPVDITSATALTLSVLESDGATVLVKSLGVAISLVDGTINQALVSFLASDFALLPQGDNDASVALQIAGQNEVMNVYSAISIEPASA